MVEFVTQRINYNMEPNGWESAGQIFFTRQECQDEEWYFLFCLHLIKNTVWHVREVQRLVKKCPHHGFPMWLQVQTFYNGLNPATRQIIDVIVGVTLNSKTLYNSLLASNLYLPMYYRYWIWGKILYESIELIKMVLELY